MFSRLEFFIAFRYLKSKRKEKFISITAIFSFIGIMLGVATLIIVMSVMNGFRDELMDKILGVNSHITVYGESGRINDYGEVIEKIRNVAPEIKTINPLIEGQGMVMASNGNVGGAIVKGIHRDDLKNKADIYETFSCTEENCEAFEEAFDGSAMAVVGLGMVTKLGLNRGGDSIKIISPETNTTLLGTIPRMKTYDIVSTFNSGMYEYDSATVFIPFETAQVHFKIKDAASAIEITIKNLDEVGVVARRINATLNANPYGEHYSVVDWKQANSAFIGALNVERNVMFIILTLIIIVAAFNIISSMIMLVNDKNRQIALLRTMGFSKGGVMRIFLICGSLIGLTGTALGVLLGTLFAANIENIRLWLERILDTNLFDPTIYFLSQLPSRVSVSDVVLTASIAVALSFLATIYPALKASKTNPAEVLRYE